MSSWKKRLNYENSSSNNNIIREDCLRHRRQIKSDHVLRLLPLPPHLKVEELGFEKTVATQLKNNNILTKETTISQESFEGEEIKKKKQETLDEITVNYNNQTEWKERAG